MNTIFYCLIFLQTTAICATHESIVVKHINQSDHSEQTITNIQKFDELYKYFKSITETNDKLKKLYNGIVDAFVTEYIKYDISRCYFSCKINHLIDYEPKKITDFCILNKAKLMKEVELYEKDIDHAFDCAFNSFVEMLIFAMDTYKILFDLTNSYGIDITAFYNDLHSNTDLLEKLILSVNCLTKFADYAFEFTLLYNITQIYVEYYDYPHLCFTYLIHHDVDYYKHNRKFVNEYFYTLIKKTMLNHYNEKKIFTSKEILQIEDCRKYKENFKTLNHLYYRDDIIEIELASSVILIERGKATKIQYIAKSGYYADRKQKTIETKYNELQENFLAHIEKVYEFNKHCKMKFDAVRIHPKQSILNYCALSKELSHKIEYLKNFTKQYTNVVIDSIKEKHKALISKFVEAMNHNNPYIIAITELEIKMNSIKTSDAIVINNEELESMETDAINDQYCNFDYIKYYNNEFEPILNSIELQCQGKGISYEYISKLKENTLNLFKMFNDIDLNKNIKEIIELQYEIDRDSKDIFNHNDAYIKHMLQKKENAIFYLHSDSMTFSQIEESEKLNQIFVEYEKNITNIMSNTIELKNKIMEAEQKAFELMKTMQEYNGNNFE